MQTFRLSVQRNHSLANVRVLLWRYLHRRPQQTPYTLCVPASKLRTCSSDTILRAIEELTEDNISYTSDNGKTYEFNKAEKLNTLLLEALLTTGQLTKGIEYDFDFDHQFIETEKYDAKTTYKQSRVCLALYCVERKVA